MQDTLKGTALSLNFDVCPDSSSLLVSGFWGDFQPEASAKAHCWTGMAAAAAVLTAPSPGPGGVLPEGQHGGTGSWPSEMLICCPDLAALGEWWALTNGWLSRQQRELCTLREQRADGTQ